MLHRDIKPANVLFTKAGEPVLTDFGIARIMGSTHMTQSGIVLGTPAYMSPEAGRGERVDERSDIYSLGIVLYEMLTGRVPFDADTPYAVIFKHITDPLPSPRTLNPEISEAVERVVLKSLAKNLEDRYQSAADMRNALDVALGSTPSEAPYLTAPLTAAQAAVPGPAPRGPWIRRAGRAPRKCRLPPKSYAAARPCRLFWGWWRCWPSALSGSGADQLAARASLSRPKPLSPRSARRLSPTVAALPPITMTPSASPFTTETANASRTETADAALAVATASDTPAL